MTTKQDPEVGNLVAEDDDAGSGVGVHTIPRSDDVVAAGQCPGPGAGEVVALPLALSAVYESRCEAKRPNSCVDLCDECLAARRRVTS